jgi:hypothetical protein
LTDRSRSVVTIFRKTLDNGGQETVFTVTLTQGVLQVSGNVDAAEMLGVPDQSLALPDGSIVDPAEEPDLYLEKLPLAYSGSRLRAEFVA